MIRTSKDGSDRLENRSWALVTMADTVSADRVMSFAQGSGIVAGDTPLIVSRFNVEKAVDSDGMLGEQFRQMRSRAEEDRMELLHPSAQPRKCGPLTCNSQIIVMMYTVGCVGVLALLAWVMQTNTQGGSQEEQQDSTIRCDGQDCTRLQ